MSEEKDTGIRILWELCSDFKLGAGGCPDGLIRQHVESLESRLKQMSDELARLQGMPKSSEARNVLRNLIPVEVDILQ